MYLEWLPDWHGHPRGDQSTDRACLMRDVDTSFDPEFLWPLLIMAVAFTMLFFTLHLMAMRNEIWRRRIATQRRMAARMAGREASP